MWSQAACNDSTTKHRKSYNSIRPGKVWQKLSHLVDCRLTLALKEATAATAQHSTATAAAEFDSLPSTVMIMNMARRIISHTSQLSLFLFSLSLSLSLSLSQSLLTLSQT